RIRHARRKVRQLTGLLLRRRVGKIQQPVRRGARTESKDLVDLLRRPTEPRAVEKMRRASSIERLVGRRFIWLKQWVQVRHCPLRKRDRRHFPESFCRSSWL